MRYSHFFSATALILALVSSGVLAQTSDLKIVANIGTDNMTVNKKQVRNLFMGSKTNIALQPVALKPENPARLVFNTKIVGLTESRIQSYWAQMRFSGRNKPPVEFDSVDQIIDYLLTHEGTVAYVPDDTVIPQQLTVLLSTN